jgi:vancomycin resistance protein YoaR
LWRVGREAAVGSSRARLLARIRGSVRADSPLFAPRARRRRRGRSALAAPALVAALFALVGLAVGLAFAGSSQELAEGTRVAGVDVGGLTERRAVARLDQRFSSVAATPVTFTAGGRSYEFAANQLGVHPDWRAAVAAAGRAGDGFGPIRGYRRLHTRFFGAEVLPRIAVSSAALEFALDRIAREVDAPPRDAALARRGLHIRLVPEQTGVRLEREEAARLVVRALGSLERGGVTALPVVVAAPAVTAPMLALPARRARIAISAPVRLQGTGRSWLVPRRRIAEILTLPKDGALRLAIAGPRADAYFRALAERVGKPPVDASFAVSGESVQIVPSRAGTELDVPRTARALLRAATSTTNRVAAVTVVRALPERTTKEALAMRIDRRMAAYKTYNSGTWDRITNLRLGVALLDDTLVPPGGTFSLNSAIGERTVERGFRPAPVIIGTEYAEEVGGGTSQVATTVFNAAWEAGLRITERNPHALYISRYPLGRDATVYWPSLDLKFVNDTSTWVLVKGFAEGDGIVVAIYGGEDRRVVSSEGAMEITGPVVVERVKDKTLPRGETVVEEAGTPPSSTSVTRTVYGEDGKLLRTETWTTAYKSAARVIRVGTKPPPPPPTEPKKPSGGKSSSTPPTDGPTTPQGPTP